MEAFPKLTVRVRFPSFAPSINPSQPALRGIASLVGRRFGPQMGPPPLPHLRLWICRRVAVSRALNCGRGLIGRSTALLVDLWRTHLILGR
jgi:hypothetical protein